MALGGYNVSTQVHPGLKKKKVQQVGSTWEIAVLPLQFCYKSKLLLNKKNKILKKSMSRTKNVVDDTKDKN